MRDGHAFYGATTIPRVNTYLVSIVDKGTGAHQQIIVRSECEHEMQEFVDGIDLPVPMTRPVVVDIDTLPLLAVTL